MNFEEKKPELETGKHLLISKIKRVEQNQS